MGPNFDIVAGLDLLDKAHEETLWKCMRTYKPLVAIISTPCRGLRGWSGINSKLHPDSWLESRREPLALGAIGAKVAQFQLDTDHHFLSENPLGSDLYHLPGWQQVAKHSRTQMLHADMCAAGLIDKETGLAIKKPSEIWFTSKHFETSLKDMRCSRDHEHAILQGTYGGETKPPGTSMDLGIRSHNCRSSVSEHQGVSSIQ